MKSLIIMASLLTTLISCFKTDKNSTKNKGENVVEILDDSGSTLQNINNSPYNILEFEIESEHCFATINQYFKGYKYKAGFPWALWIKVETKVQNYNGHPTGAEALHYNSLEDSIIELLNHKTPFCFIGRTTRAGFREIIIFVADKPKTTELMNKFILEDKFKREIEFTIDFDDKWTSVSGFIE